VSPIPSDPELFEPPELVELSRSAVSPSLSAVSVVSVVSVSVVSVVSVSVVSVSVVSVVSVSFSSSGFSDSPSSPSLVAVAIGDAVAVVVGDDVVVGEVVAVVVVVGVAVGVGVGVGVAVKMAVGVAVAVTVVVVEAVVRSVGDPVVEVREAVEVAVVVEVADTGVSVRSRAVLVDAPDPSPFESASVSVSEFDPDRSERSFASPPPFPFSPPPEFDPAFEAEFDPSSASAAGSASVPDEAVEATVVAATAASGVGSATLVAVAGWSVPTADPACVVAGRPSSVAFPVSGIGLAPNILIPATPAAATSTTTTANAAAASTYAARDLSNITLDTPLNRIVIGLVRSDYLSDISTDDSVERQLRNGEQPATYGR
jgi:hypothetical protein